MKITYIVIGLVVVGIIGIFAVTTNAGIQTCVWPNRCVSSAL